MGKSLILKNPNPNYKKMPYNDFFIINKPYVMQPETTKMLINKSQHLIELSPASRKLRLCIKYPPASWKFAQITANTNTPDTNNTINSDVGNNSSIGDKTFLSALMEISNDDKGQVSKTCKALSMSLPSELQNWFISSFFAEATDPIKRHLWLLAMKRKYWDGMNMW